MPNLTLRAARENGALVEIAIGPSEARARATEQAGLQAVLPQVIYGLVDTGSELTIIDEEVASRLGLIPSGEREIRTPGSGEEVRTLPCFDVRLEFVAPERHLISNNFRVAGGKLPRRTLGALIGRDLLARCLFIYNGPEDQFTFSY